MENLFLTIVGVICIVIVVFQVVFKFVIESRSFCGSSVYVIRNSRITSARRLHQPNLATAIMKIKTACGYTIIIGNLRNLREHSCLSATESVKVRSVMLALQSFLITMVLKCMLWIIEVMVAATDTATISIVWMISCKISVALSPTFTLRVLSFPFFFSDTPWEAC
ncbi:uncharacterized protein [Blastocystis hominis]|uniref:Uncharacterized protein n=1 Tax=Blastocystis hominis TaxID=12968 RepID=D8MBH7_BLAHO|nr:uncharacterized protein [Blastocystis hominis]CBK25416.2 unnamed protein product [Blastocystis hominis]|eukprot:XP_012899464.1 uncharacterized protein [Blastocystis hominis]